LLALVSGPMAFVQASAGWATNGPRIVNATSGDFIVGGINWYGFETTDRVAHGLWARDYRAIVDQIKQSGFNTIRLPFSNEMWETNPLPAAGQVAACPSCAGKHARDILAMIINYAGAAGVHVILDNHRSDAGNSAQESGLWYTPAFPEQAWIRDWISA